MRRILFINPFGIGDCLFTTPLIAAIKNQWPDSFIGYWCNQRVSEILESNPNVDVVFPLSRGDFKRIYRQRPLAKIKNLILLFLKIRQAGFDIALDFSLDHRYGLLAKLCGIKRRMGIDYLKRGKFLTEKLEISGYNDKHIVEYYLKILDFLNIKANEPKLELFVDKEARDWAQSYLKKNEIGLQDRLIGICPGAGESWGKDAFIKRWDVENFSKVCDRLLSLNGTKILLFGNQKDEGACREVYNLISKKENVFKVYPDFSLSQFSALLEKCQLLITNDGGPLHMAVALDLKTVSIFGPVDDLVYGPYPKSADHIVIKSDCDCRPCYKNFRIPECENGRKCLTDITVDMVFSAAKGLLG